MTKTTCERCEHFLKQFGTVVPRCALVCGGHCWFAMETGKCRFKEIEGGDGEE